MIPEDKKPVNDLFSSQTKCWDEIYRDDNGNQNKNQYDKNTIIKRRDHVLRIIDNQAKLHKSIRMLDVGCGTGEVVGYAARNGHEAVGIDLSYAMLLEARKKCGKINCHFLRGDIEQLSFQSDTFDVISCLGVLQYLVRDQQGVAELCRVAKNGGVIIYSLPNLLRLGSFFDPYYILIRGFHFLRYLVRKKSNEHGKRLTTEEMATNKNFCNRRYLYGQLDKLFLKEGCKRVSIQGIGYGPFTLFKIPVLPEALMLRISNFLESAALSTWMSWLNLFATRWVVCVRKAGKPPGADCKD